MFRIEEITGATAAADVNTFLDDLGEGQFTSLLSQFNSTTGFMVYTIIYNLN